MVNPSCSSLHFQKDFGLQLLSYAIWRLNHQTETTLIVSGMDRAGGNGDRHGHES